MSSSDEDSWDHAAPEDPVVNSSLEQAAQQRAGKPMPSRSSFDSFLRPTGSSSNNNREATITSTSETSRAPALEDADGRWEAMITGLIDYKMRHDTLNVPRDYRWNGRNLYEWCRNQRKHYLNGIRGKTPALLPRRRARLEAIGFELDPTGAQGENDAFDDKRWVAMFEGLVRFHRQYGSFAVPIGYQCDGRSLHDWLRHQRKQYALTADGKRAALSAARIDRLLSIGFDLDSTGRKQDRRSEEERWEIMFQGLREHQRRHGLLISESATHDGRSLPAWVENQRRLYTNFLRNQQPALSPEQAKRLQSIGFALRPHDASPEAPVTGSRTRSYSQMQPLDRASSPRRTRIRGTSPNVADDSVGAYTWTVTSSPERALLSPEAIRLAQCALEQYQRQRR